MKKEYRETALKTAFFERETLTVARDLLGMRLYRRLPSGESISALIVETEAYTAQDPACHAFGQGLESSKGRRAQPLFGQSGLAYVYFIYGMYHCLNAVTEPEGIAGAVLIRALDGPGLNGPGKICRQLRIDLSHNLLPLTDTKSELFIAQADGFKDSQVRISPRIGISKAKELPWRFFVQGNPYLSGSKEINCAGLPLSRLTSRR